MLLVTQSRTSSPSTFYPQELALPQELWRRRELMQVVYVCYCIYFNTMIHFLHELLTQVLEVLSHEKGLLLFSIATFLSISIMTCIQKRKKEKCTSNKDRTSYFK